MNSVTPNKFQHLVLAWFDQYGRKTLPWQQNKTPYRVWVSEIMLQQTQVSTVIPYFQRFMIRFPDIYQLAHASEDDVLHLWTGLGYYSRARNLHKTAKIILQSYQGIFPDNLEELQKLPGIGRSTAGAILAIAFQQPATILDGNVKRVLTRLHGITEWPGEKNTTTQLWDIAKKLTPTTRIADYTQAMMDIGATLCIRGKPQCTICPLKKYCIADKLGIAKQLPRPKPRKILSVKQATLLILLKDNCVLLEKRPASGIWGGLWSLPEIPGTPSHQEIRKFCRQRFRLAVDMIEMATTFRHTFSHFHLDISPALISSKKNFLKVMEAEQQIWYNVSKPKVVGLPAPVKQLLHAMAEENSHK